MEPVVVRFSYEHQENEECINVCQSFCLGSGILHTELFFPHRHKRATVDMEQGMTMRTYNLDSLLHTIDHKSGMRPHKYYQRDVDKALVDGAIRHIQQTCGRSDGYDNTMYCAIGLCRFLPNAVLALCSDRNRQTCARMVYDTLRNETVMLIDGRVHGDLPSVTPDYIKGILDADQEFSVIDQETFIALYRERSRRNLSASKSAMYYSS